MAWLCRSKNCGYSLNTTSFIFHSRFISSKTPGWLALSSLVFTWLYSPGWFSNRALFPKPSVFYRALPPSAIPQTASPPSYYPVTQKANSYRFSLSSSPGSLASFLLPSGCWLREVGLIVGRLSFVLPVSQTFLIRALYLSLLWLVALVTLRGISRWQYKVTRLGCYHVYAKPLGEDIYR